MTVTKRSRFEVLRRDNHTCMYCGRIAPDVALQIDHFVPVALGGSDDPSNLVTACVDCNSGKSSIQPDSPLVKQVSDHAAAYALGMLDRITQLRADLEREKDWQREFLEQWNVWTYPGPDGSRQTIDLPSGWQESVVRWRAMGVPPLLLEKAIRIAMEKHNRDSKVPEFAYMAGVIWRTIDALEVDYDLTPEHALAYTKKDLDREVVAAHDRGYELGESSAMQQLLLHELQDLVTDHIDGNHGSWAMTRMKVARRGT